MTPHTTPHHARALGRALILSIAVIAASAFTATAATRTTVSNGIKEMGWSSLPTYLDAATESITIKFPSKLGGGKLTFGGTIDADALKEKTFIFDTSDDHKLTWSHAFGLPWLNLVNTAMHLEVGKGKFELSLSGQVTGALGHSGNQPRDVTISIDVEDKQIKDFVLSLPDTSLAMSSLPGAKNLKGASSIKISAPTISRHSIGGKMSFKGETIDAVVFFDTEGKKWIALWRLEKALTIGTLIGHNKGFLKDIGLPKMQVAVSTADLKVPYGDLPLAVQQFYTQAGSLPDGDLELKNGINLESQFNPAILPSKTRGALSKIGLNEVLPITGVIGGLFGGEEPYLEIAVDIEPPGNHGFPFLKVKNNAKAEFFMSLSKEDEALGFKTEIELPGGKGRLPIYFDVSFEIEEKGAEIEAAVSGAMQGDWKDAANIKGLTLENPFLSVGINETAGFDVMIDGTVMVGKTKVRAAADIVLQAEAAFVPDALAFAGTVNKIPLSDIAYHAEKAVRLKGNGLKNLDAELRDLEFAFMTPGASLPAGLEAKLKIEGAGMAINGQFWLKGKELGGAGGYASTEGIRFDGSISPFKLGPLDLKQASLLIQAGPKIDPELSMSGDIALFKGFEDKYKLMLEPQKFNFYTDTKFGGAFEAELQAESDGLSFAPGNDFEFEALLAAKYSEEFKKLMQAAVQTFKKGEHDIGNAQRKVKDAEHKVSELNSKISAAKAKAKRDYENASGKINEAQRKVDSINRTIHDVRNKIHDLQHDIHEDKKHWRFDKAAEHGVALAAQETALAADETALKTATGVLNAAKGATKVGTEDISPEVRALQTELGTAEAALKVAEGVLDAAKAADKGLEAASKAIEDSGREFRLNKLGASGSLRGIVSGGREGRAPVLIVDCTIVGRHHVYHWSIDSLEKGFQKIADELAKQVAKDLVNALKKV